MIDDESMIQWLEEDTERLQDVYWQIENYGGTVREAIERFMDNRERRSKTRFSDLTRKTNEVYENNLEDKDAKSGKVS